MRALLALTIALLMLSCAEGTPTPVPSPTSILSRYNCSEIATSVKELTEDKVSQITDIYRLHMTVDSATLRECEGRAEWSHGQTVGITIYTEERDGSLWSGYETHEAIRMEPTLPSFLAPTDTPAPRRSDPVGDRAMVMFHFDYEELIVFLDTTFDAAPSEVTVVVNGERYVNSYPMRAVPDPTQLGVSMDQFAVAANEKGYGGERDIYGIAIEYSGGRLQCEVDEIISRRWLCTE